MINFFKKNSGYFAMLLAVIGFGAGPPFVTLALKEFYIIDLLAVRFFIAFLLMIIFCLIMRVDISIKQVGLKPFLMGLLNPTEGKITVDDKDISKNLKGWQKNIFLVQQDNFILDDSIKNNITLGEDKNFFNLERYNKSIKELIYKTIKSELKN